VGGRARRWAWGPSRFRRLIQAGRTSGSRHLAKGGWFAVPGHAGEAGLLIRQIARDVPVVLLVFVHVGLVAWGASRHSPTWDEPGHLVAGIGHWQFGTYDLMRVNPPLVRMVATVPVLVAGPKSDWSSYDASVGVRSDRLIRRDFIEINGRRAFWFHTLARWACIPLSLLGAYICFRWARELYGRLAGILALALWCFSPNVIAHGQLLTPDAGATAMGVAAAYCLWRWLGRPTWKRAVAAGVVLGLAELTKMTWIVLFGLWPVLWIVYRLAGQQPGEGPHPDPLPKGEGAAGENAECRMQNAEGGWARHGWQMAVILLLGLYVLNLGYGFEGSFQRLGDYGFVSEALGGPIDEGQGRRGREVRNRFEGTWLACVRVPVPKNYLMGIDLQKSDFENKMSSYLRGEWRMGGWWYYYLYALAIKEPLGTWVLVFLAAGVSLWRGGNSRSPHPSPLPKGEGAEVAPRAPGPSTLAPREVVATEVATPNPSPLNPRPSPLNPQPSPLAPRAILPVGEMNSCCWRRPPWCSRWSVRRPGSTITCATSCRSSRSCSSGSVGSRGRWS
jgi:hypothetical protein